MIIRDTLSLSPESITFGETLIVDPSSDYCPFLEAQILSPLVDASSKEGGVLFDLRNAWEIRGHDTGVLVFNDLLELTWAKTALWPTDLVAHSVMGWDARVHIDSFVFRFFVDPSAVLAGRCGRAWFVAGHTRDVPGTPTDYTGETPHSIRGRIASWESEFVPQAWFRLEAGSAADIVPEW
ncbi:MAG: hypothetical protein LBJ44_03790 [Propionibacteriaceae bacterium]|jgi:hypothetical protein|nr:hypothetical protein [Propionibacteriaceae bacterium]